MSKTGRSQEEFKNVATICALLLSVICCAGLVHVELALMTHTAQLKAELQQLRSEGNENFLHEGKQFVYNTRKGKFSFNVFIIRLTNHLHS